MNDRKLLLRCKFVIKLFVKSFTDNPSWEIINLNFC